MAVYIISEVEIVDPEVYSRYAERVDEVLKKYGGRFLVRGGQVIPLSGNWHPKRISVVEFESQEQVMMRCLTSVEFLDSASLREQASFFRAIVVEGCQPTEEE